MSNDHHWIESKKEREIDVDGAITSQKITFEKKKNIDAKDLFDIIIKALALAGILFTALTYFNTLNQQELISKQATIDRQKVSLKEKETAIAKLQEDSTNNLKYQREQSRLDKELRLKQDDILLGQINNNRELNQRQSQFERTLAHSLEVILKQENADLDKEKVISQFRLYRAINSDLLKLFNDSIDQKEFNRLKNIILNEHYPNLIAYRDTDIIKTFDQIKHYIEYYQSLMVSFKIADSMRNCSNKILQNMDFARNILSRFNINKEISDTTFYLDNKNRITAQRSLLVESGSLMLKLKFSHKNIYKGDIEDNYYKIMHLVENDIPNDYKEYEYQVNAYLFAGLGIYLQKKTKEYEQNAEKIGREIGGVGWKESLKKISGEIDSIKALADEIKEHILDLNEVMEDQMVKKDKLTTSLPSFKK